MDVDGIGQVVIIGQKSLQNTLLCNFIHDKTNYRCTLHKDVAHVAGDTCRKGHLALLIDTQNARADTFAAGLEVISDLPCPPFVAFINAEVGGPADKFIIWAEVRGIFYKDATPDEIAKGVVAIFQGEYWFSRRLLSAYLERTRGKPQRAVVPPELLTRKELQVLKWLANGDTNTIIAERLNVSLHTVKTHLYNLFRKISVRNRVQAVLWARNHIETMEEEC